MPRLLLEAPQAQAQMPRTNPNAYGAQIGAAMDQTGRLSQALGQVLNEYAESKSRSAAVQYEQELRAGAAQIEADPDIAGREEKLDTLARRLHSAYTPKLGSRSVYDERAGFATNDVRTSLMAKTAADATNEVRLNAELEANYRIQSAVATGDEQQIGVAFLEAQTALHDASLAYTPAQQTAAFQNVVGQGIRSLADMHPKLALDYIDKMGPMLGPEVQSVYRAEAMTNIRQSAALNVAAAKAERDARITAEKDASAAAEERLMDLEQSGRLSLDAVRSEGDLTPSAYRRWKGLATGGKSGGSGSDPGAYIDLSDRANAGVDVVEEANTAFTDGQISRVERDAIVKTSRDERFAQPRKSVLGALKTIEERRPSAAGVTGVGLSKFDSWVKDNPGATRSQADARAAEIIIESKAYRSPDRAPAAASPSAARPLDSMDAITSELKAIAQRRKLNLISQADYDKRKAELFAAQRDIADENAK